MPKKVKGKKPRTSKRMRALVTSAGPGKHMRSLIKLMKSHVRGMKKGQTLHVVVLRDARPQNPEAAKEDIRAVKRAIRKAGCKPKVHIYEFYKDKKGVDHARMYLRRKRSVVLVFGGNTFRLNAGIRHSKPFKRTLRNRIRRGQALYVSRSAGSILFGRSVAIASDDKAGLKKVCKGGLRLYGKKTIRPHAEQKPAKKALEDFKRHRPRAKVVTLTDNQALYFNGKKRKRVTK